MAAGQRRRYALIGTGHRAEMYFDALLRDYADVAEPVALCDPNPARMAYYQRKLDRELPAYHPGDYGRLLDGVRPDVVVVTTVDATHPDYVVAALDRGIDVIVEKPLAVDAAGCARIAEAAQRSTGRLVVTFNYRYAPRNSTVKRLLREGAVGEVTAVHFEWLLDTVHGADYFRRWHRDKANSGGLFVHKASHHFDLVNWWLDAEPETVSAHAGLRFYGPDNAAARGLGPRPARSHGSDAGDPFAVDLAASPRLRALYLDAEGHDGYVRDQDVFASGVTIEDTMAALVRYDSGAFLTYSLTAYAPWEGYRVSITGTAGRLELEVCERAAVAGGSAGDIVGGARPAIDPSAAPEAPGAEGVRPTGTRLLLQRQWGRAREVPVDESGGGHGGGDARLLDDLFRPGVLADPLGRAAGWRDGVMSVLVGAAANESAATGAPVRLALPRPGGRGPADDKRREGST